MQGIARPAVADVLPDMQAQLKPSKVDKLRSLVPTLTDELVEEMARAPFRNWDEDLTKEPLIFRCALPF